MREDLSWARLKYDDANDFWAVSGPGMGLAGIVKQSDEATRFAKELDLLRPAFLDVANSADISDHLNRQTFVEQALQRALGAEHLHGDPEELAILKALHDYNVRVGVLQIRHWKTWEWPEGASLPGIFLNLWYRGTYVAQVRKGTPVAFG